MVRLDGSYINSIQNYSYFDLTSTLKHTLKWTGLVTSGGRLLVGSGNRQKVNKPFIEDYQMVGMKEKIAMKKHKWKCQWKLPVID